jgi:hypothetical protein
MPTDEATFAKVSWYRGTFHADDAAALEAILNDRARTRATYKCLPRPEVVAA